MLKITLTNNNHYKNRYSVFVDNGNRQTESRFSHASKARKYVNDFFEQDEIMVDDKIIEPIKKIKHTKWWK